MKQNNRPERLDPEFFKAIQEIRADELKKRIESKSDNLKPLSFAKITKAFTKYNDFPKIKELIKKEYKW